MSNLTNEVLRKAMSELNFSSSCIDWTTDEREAIIKTRSRERWINEIPNAIMNYLYKNHYDVEDLIGRNLAVDFNTLKQ